MDTTEDFIPKSMFIFFKDDEGHIIPYKKEVFNFINEHLLSTAGFELSYGEFSNPQELLVFLSISACFVTIYKWQRSFTVEEWIKVFGEERPTILHKETLHKLYNEVHSSDLHPFEGVATEKAVDDYPMDTGSVCLTKRLPVQGDADSCDGYTDE